MKRFFRLILTLSIILTVGQGCFAAENLLVLPDNINFESPNYYIYPDSSVMFASDVINNIKANKQIQIVSMKTVRDSLRMSSRTRELAHKVMDGYKYNYNVDFIDLKDLAKRFNTNKILLITSTTDSQNYVMKRSWWSFINVPGVALIDPTYRVNSMVSLVDVDKEVVLWEKNYSKSIRADEDRILAVNFAPASEQLTKLKYYSTNEISPDIALYVESKLVPSVITMPAARTVFMPKFKVQKVKPYKPQNQNAIQNIDFKTPTLPESRPVLNQIPDFMKNDSIGNDL
jgi:hypothetical protein